jgi:DUF971 family protein
VAIAAERATGQLTITWADGQVYTTSFEQLRWACPCAVCQGEGGQPGLLARTRRLEPQQFELVDLRAVGLYGVSPLWADGHDTGIYPYPLLRRLGEAAS